MRPDTLHSVSIRLWQRPPVAHVLLFFCLLPALIGVLLGATRAGVAVHFPWSTGLTFWVMASLAVWICLYLGSAGVAVLLRPWNPPLWLVLLVGALVGSAPARYVVFGCVVLLSDQMQGGRTPQPLPAFELSVPFVLGYLQGWTGVFVAWVAAGLIFNRWLGFPRFAPVSKPDLAPVPQTTLAEPESAPPVVAPPAVSAPAVAPSIVAASLVAPPAAPTLLDRLPAKLGRNVVALEAEDHYVRVHTELGSTLLLARLSDAIEEMRDLDGVRVHRSWWVRCSAVRAVVPNGKGLLLTLNNGTTVPVSHAYKEIARQAGLTPTQG